MKKFVLFTILLACFSHMWASISVQTQIHNGNSQPPIVGGVISEYSESSIQEKGLIISASADGCVYDASADKYNHNFSAKNEYKNPHSILETYRIIDCSNIGKEQFWCSVLALKSNTDYYVRAYLVKEDGSVIYGEVKQMHSQTFNRYNSSTDVANVWHAFDSTLFDLISDEIINPSDGFYYSTNENPTTVRHQVGTGYNTCYKYATEWNYKLWYYHSGHCVQTKIVDMPVMTLSGNKLHIEKSTLDADKDITIYYSINGDYFRPETYTDKYTDPIEIQEPCTVYCYAISSDGYISYTNMYVVSNVSIDLLVQTQIHNGNSQPPIVGGVISEYSESSIQEKGLIISVSEDGCVYDATADKYNHNFSAKNEYKNPHSILSSYRIIDCSNIGREQFWCSIIALKSNTVYYVRAYVVEDDGSVIYGDVRKIHSQTFNRYNSSTDVANVWHAFDSTLFDLISDEIINPSDGFYYSTNENPTTVRHQVGTGYNTCYKYATEWNYKLWYYHSGHCVQEKIVDMPVMTFSGNKLYIEKSPLDSDENITIYYSIDGDYFRPETYTDVYTNPIEIQEPCTVYCYAISSDGYISYTNMYFIDDVHIGEEDGIEDVCMGGNDDARHNGGKRVIYDLYGRCQPKMQKGLNIIKYADGSVKRIMERK